MYIGYILYFFISFIPDIGELYQGHERPQLVDQFESDTNKMLDNWKDYGISKLL